MNDLRRAEYNTFDRHIKKLARLLHSSGLDPISNKLTANVDLEAWIKAGEATQGGMVGSAQLEWPANSEEELGLVIQLIDRFAEKPETALDFSHTFYYNGSKLIHDRLIVVETSLQGVELWDKLTSA